MAQYRVVIKKTVECSVVVEADSVAEARSMVTATPEDWFPLAQEFDRDIFKVGKVTKAAK